jgi:5'-3' exonuclease
MGIPSFYRHLCRRFPKIVSRGVPVETQWLCLDFNCAMYYVLHKMPPLGNDWETKFCTAIVAYLEEIVAAAKPTKGLYVSCDGVVCAAKRRQQRLRRFKGPWVSANEAVLKGLPSVEKWDQNALTPGSAFMQQLNKALTAAGKQLQKELKIDVVMSTTAEPGEGEHKLLAHMRSVLQPTERCTIYGLDADLILLSMLLVADTGASVSLLREEQEFERSGSGSGSAPVSGWRHLDIGELTKAILPGFTKKEHVYDFVAAMSLLGNDFLPKSLTYTVRNDGIPAIVATLKTLWSADGTLVANGKIQKPALLQILASFSKNEEAAMLAACVEAIKMRARQTGGTTPEEQALNEWNAQPAKWATILQLYNSNKRCLRPDWRTIYRERFAHTSSATEYCAGLAWVWDYYSGRPVDLGWDYDGHLPPLWSDLWSDLYETLKNNSLEPPPLRYTTYLPAWLHLVSVLPIDSAKHLLPNKHLGLLTKVPWYWPSSFALFDVGRSQIWECEAVIPVFPEALLRSQI